MVLEMGEKNDILPHDKNDVQDNTSCVIDPQAPNLDNNVKLEFDIVRHRVFPQAHNLDKDVQLEFDTMTLHIDPQVKTLVDSLVSEVIEAENEVEKEEKKTKRKRKVFITNIFQDEDPAEIAIAYSFEEMNRVFEEYKTRTGIDFSTVGKALHSGRPKIDISKPLKIRWYQNEKKFACHTPSWRGDSEINGVPYLYCGKSSSSCEFGKNPKKTKSDGSKKIRKKLGCPALLNVRKITMFPQFKLDDIDQFDSKTLSSLTDVLRESLLAEDKELRRKVVYVLSFPKDSTHRFHNPSEQATSNNLDKQIILKIQDMVLQDFTTTQINQQFIVGELFYGQTLPEKTDKRYYPGAHQVGNNRKIIHLFYTMTKDDIANLNGQFTVMRENGDKVIFEIDTPPDRSKITSYVRMKDRVAAGNVNKELEHFSNKQEQGTTISAELKHTSNTSGRNEQVHKRDGQCPKVVQCVNSEVQKTELNILNTSEAKEEKFDRANTCTPESLQSEDSELPDAQMSISNDSDAKEFATSTLTSSQKVRNRPTPCNDNNKQSDLNTSKEIFVGLDEKNSARITNRNSAGMVESTTQGHGNEKKERNVITSQSSFQQGEIQTHKDSTANKPKKDSLRIQKFYLFHQTVKQQYLLNRYGEIVFILEIKPKQCGFRAIAVSLFIICVQTNVDYQVVGTILCNKYNDHVKVLTEALTEFKEINSSWKPKYLIIHPSETMVSVVHHLFAGVEYYFNKDSCLQEWEEYLTNQKNGLKEHSTKLLRDLETLQSSSSMDEFKQNANQLSRCPIWKSESTSTFRQNWFAGSKRWVACRLPRNLLVLLKDEWLKSIIGCYEGAVILSTSRSSKEGGIVHLIERLTVTLVKDRFESYILKNKTYLTNNVLVAKQNPSLMTDLGIPLNMTSHCAHIMNPMNEIQPQKIKQINHNQFEVTTRKTHTNTTHIVTVAGNQAAFPSCSCAEWKNNAILCQHMFMVIQSFKFQFDWLSPLYRESPFFQIDQISINSDLIADSTSMGLQEMLSEPVQEPTTLVSTVLDPANNVKSSSGHSSKTKSEGEKSGFQMKIAVQSSVDRVTARTINLVSLKDGNATPVVDEINCLEKAHTVLVNKDEHSNLNEKNDLEKEDSGFDDTIPTIPMMIEPQRSSRQDVLEQSKGVSIGADSVKTNSQHVANIKENLLKYSLNTINFAPSNVNENSRLHKDLAKADSKTKGAQIIEELTPAVTKGTFTLPPRRSIFKKNLQMNSCDIIVFKRFIVCMEELCYFDENFIAQVKEEFQREIQRTDSESVILQSQNDYNTVKASLATEFRNNDVTMATDNNEVMPIIIECKSLANQNGVNNVTLADDITLNFTGTETSSLNNAKKEDPRSVLGNFAKLSQSVFPDSSRQQSDRTNRKQNSIEFRCNIKSDQPLSPLYQNKNLTINFPPNTRPSKNNFSTNVALTKPIDSLESIQKQSIKSASTANLLSKNETSQLCDNLTRASVVASKTAINIEKTSATTHTMKSPIIESNDNESCRIVIPTKKRSFKFRKLNKQQKTTSPLASKE
uniref:SWIM-type domain-containing protein n=1 Tax=Clytia hemisphaerica TaxID=252671 RepID=A0A7M5UR56_9CNID